MLDRLIKHDIAVIFFFMFVFALGAAALLTIDTNLLPLYRAQALTIVTDYYGMEPTIIEETITKPLERALREIVGIRDVVSISQKGRSKLIVYLSPEEDLDRMAVTVMDRVYQVSDSFPREVHEPALYTYSTDDSPVMIIALDSSGISSDELSDQVERNLKPKLMSVDGVANIDALGPGRKEYMLELNYTSLLGLGLSYEEVLEKITAGSASLPAGSFAPGQDRVPVTFQNRYTDLKKLPSFPIRVNGRLLNGSEIFSVSSQRREEERISYVNNREVLTLYIFKKDSASILSLYRGVRKALESFKGYFSYEFLYDQAESFRVLLINLTAGALMALGIIFAGAAIFYKRLFHALVITMSAPLCTAAAAIFLKLAGKSLNLMTLGGLIVGMGVCAGNCIIFIEALSGGDGEPPAVQAIEKAIEKAQRPVISSTLITVIVFLPLFFLGDKNLSLYADFSLSITSMLLFSCAVSLLFIPALMLRFGKGRGEPAVDRSKEPHQLTPQKGSNNPPDIFNQKLSIWVRSIARRLYRSPVVVLVPFFICGGFLLFALVKMPYEEIWPLNERSFEFHFEFDPEYSQPYKEKAIAEIGEKILGMRLPLLLVSNLEGERAAFFVKFTGKRRTYIKGVQRLKEYLVSGRRDDGFFYMPEGRGAGVRSIRLSFFGDNLERLDSLVDGAAAGILELEGVRQVLKGYRRGKPQIDLTPLPGKMAFYGITAAEVIQFLRFVFYHPVVMKHYERGAVSDVRGKILIEDFHREDIAFIRVPGVRMSGAPGPFIPLGDLMHISHSSGPGSITRKNGKRFISLEIVYEGVKETVQLSAVSSYLKSLRFEKDMYFEFDPELIERRQSAYTLAGALGLALFLIYVVLGIASRSFDAPLSILCTMPSIFFGSMPFLWASRYPRSVPVHLALMLLAGLSVRSVIMLAGKVAEARAAALEEAVSKGFGESIRILLPLSLVTAAAFVPVFLMSTSTNFFKVVTGVAGTGLVLSIFLSMAVFPALFRVFHERRAPVK